MKKIVINACYGGFSLSPEACLWLYEKGYRGEENNKFAYPINERYKSEKDEDEFFGKKKAITKWREYLAKGKAAKRESIFLTVFSPCEQFVLGVREIPRDNALLIECVETLGKDADGACAQLKIVSIPDDIQWEIDEYDGYESVDEVHRTWG